jgi:hypothetical protein
MTPKQLREREAARARLFDIEKWKGLHAEGYVRATSSAPTLRRHGFEVVMARNPYGSAPYREAPFAKKWAVEMARSMRGLDLRPEVRAAAFAEALDLGRPGPLAQAAVTAGRMMK